MGHLYQQKHLGFLLLAAVASGCQSAPRGDYAGYAPTYPTYDYGSVAPAAGPLPAGTAPMAAAPAPVYPPVPYQALEAANISLKERLERVEKAMLRLDRRMQLVERNELNRMSDGSTPQQQVSELSGSEEQIAMRSLNIGPGRADAMPADYQGYRPVSSRSEGITSALQAAPSMSVSSLPEPADASPRHGNALPSLADPVQSGRSLQPAGGDVAIWTVRYQPDKIWPDRSQLPSSRDVVESLRGAGSVSLFARGKNANGVEFRERVKALSRYLSKVSSLDSVPIAAMPAPHLDDETIEILATH